MSNDNLSTEVSARSNSNLAVISLVFGILGLTIIPFIGSIVAVITAPLAKKEIHESQGTLGGEELAVIGQILGWIGIALFGFGFCCCLVLFVIPVLASLGIIIGSESYPYWIMPGVLNFIF